LLIFVTILLLSGCGNENKNSGQSKDIEEEKDVEENVEEVSDVEDVNVQTAAWQDEFTRDFLVSSEETEEGYYTFKSGVDGYTMLYPVNGVLDHQTYYKYQDEEKEEVINFWDIRKDENFHYSIIGHFKDLELNEGVEKNLELLVGTDKFVTPGDFEQYTIEDKDIYFAQFIHKISDNENGFFIRFWGYAKSNSSNKSMALNYSSKCLSKTEECKLNIDQEKERMKKILHSVRFTP